MVGGFMQTAVAAYVSERALRSIHLLEGLRAALIASGRNDLAKIAELISDDALAARTAIQLAHERRTRTRKRAVVDDLQRLSQVAGPESAEIILRAGRILERICG